MGKVFAHGISSCIYPLDIVVFRVIHGAETLLQGLLFIARLLPSWTWAARGIARITMENIIEFISPV